MPHSTIHPNVTETREGQGQGKVRVDWSKSNCLGERLRDVIPNCTGPAAQSLGQSALGYFKQGLYCTYIYIYVYTVQYIVCVCVCVYASDPTVKQPTEKTPRTLDDVSMNAPRRAWPNNLNPTEVDG